MAAKLLAGGRILPHRDSHPSFGVGHRIHVPIVTNPRVRFMIDGRPYQLEVGQAYEINNQKIHSVMNKGDTDRINFIFDYVPPSATAGSRRRDWRSGGVRRARNAGSDRGSARSRSISSSRCCA